MRMVHSKDLSVVWTCFLMKIVGLWLAADQAEQRRRNFALIYTICALVIATFIAIRDIYFSWGNFSDCVYITCNILYLMIVFFKIAVLYTHRTEFFDLIRSTEQSYWIPSSDPREVEILGNCKRLCDRVIVFMSFCCQGTCAGYIVTPIMANIGKNHSERVLPFNMWVDFDTGASPYFEVLFTIQILCVYHVGVCYLCFDNFLYLTNLNVACQFRILQHRLMNLNCLIKRQLHDQDPNNLSIYANECRVKLKNCVRQHQALVEYCRKVENVFTLIALGQVTFLAMAICFVGYQIFLMVTPPSRTIGLTLNMMGCMCQLLMFTYSCDGMIQQSSCVGKAVFSIPWTVFPMNRFGKSLRKDVVIMIMRSSKHCCITAGGFFPVSLETFTGVLSTAMSYFTLLRRSAPDFVNF